MVAGVDLSTAEWRLLTRFHNLNKHPRGRRQRSVFDPHDAADASVAKSHHEPHTAHVFAVLNLNSVRLYDAVVFDSRQGISVGVAHCLDIEIRNTRCESAGKEGPIPLEANRSV